jgi:hypothetical protein
MDKRNRSCGFFLLPFSCFHKALISVSVGGLFPAFAVAQNSQNSSENLIRELYSDPEPVPLVRARSMGGAGIALGDDGDALFLNPAGIGREEGERTKNILRAASFPNVSAGGSPASVDMRNALSKSKVGQSEQERLVAAARKHSTSYNAVGFFPYLTIQRFQLGLIGHTSLHTYRNKNDSISAKFRSVAGLAAGFSIPYKASGFSLGVGSRFVMRRSISATYQKDDTVASEHSREYSDKETTTQGVAVDVGALYNFHLPLGPSLGIRVTDVADTSYKSKNTNENREIEKTMIGFGGALRPELSSQIAIALAADVQRINDANLTLQEKVKLGAEMSLGSLLGAKAPLSLRVGHNLHAFSGGLGVELIFLRLDLSTSGEPIKGDEGTRVSRQYLAKVSVDLRT